MPDNLSLLENLRAEIDRIDGEILALLVARAQIVEQVVSAKPAGGLPVRPDREVAIIRRLLEDHQGAFPEVCLVRIWREIIAGCTAIQRDMVIAVTSDGVDGNPGIYRELARDYYGTVTRLQPGGTPVATVRLVADEQAGLGILPWPSGGPDQLWWTSLMATDGQAPKVIAGLPLASEGRDANPQALVVARFTPVPCGDDRSLIGLELEQDLSRSRLRSLLDAADLDARQFWTWSRADGPANPLVLVEVEGFVGDEDARLITLIDRLGDQLLNHRVLGSFTPTIRLKARNEGANT